MTSTSYGVSSSASATRNAPTAYSSSGWEPCITRSVSATAVTEKKLANQAHRIRNCRHFLRCIFMARRLLWQLWQLRRLGIYCLLTIAAAPDTNCSIFAQHFAFLTPKDRNKRKYQD